MKARTEKLKAGRPTQETPAPTLDDLKQSLTGPIARLNANVPKPWYKRVKQRALDEDITVTELVVKAVDEYLGKRA
jgi:hypothetical protein